MWPSGRAPPGSQIYRASSGPPPFSVSNFVPDPHATSGPDSSGPAAPPMAPISRRYASWVCDDACTCSGRYSSPDAARAAEDVLDRLGRADHHVAGRVRARPVAGDALAAEELELQIEDPAHVARGERRRDFVGDPRHHPVVGLFDVEDGRGRFHREPGGLARDEPRRDREGEAEDEECGDEAHRATLTGSSGRHEKGGSDGGDEARTTLPEPSLFRVPGYPGRLSATAR